VSRASIASLLLLALAAPATASAQLVLADRGVRAGGLWCFPLASDERQWVYVPAAARLATDPAGTPEFSFMLYTLEASPDPAEPGAPAGGDASTITRSGGGAVLHFLVLYETPPELVTAAQKELRRTLGRDDLVIRGPVVFKEGRYALVSAVIDRGAPERKLLDTGRAPVLEGNRLALAFDLTPEQASVLMQSFAMSTPDVSLVFDLAFEGLSDAYQADLTVNWAEVRSSKAFSAGGSVYFVGADVQLALDELRRTHAITLTTAGDSPATEALVSAVYDKLVKLLFSPVEPERIPADQRGGLEQALAALVDPRSGVLSSRKTTGFGLNVAFQLKDLRSEGKSVMHFDHRATLERHALVAFNIGDLRARWPGLFVRRNPTDPAFRQREVHVAVDGSLLPELGTSVDSVTVTLRKQHAGGPITVKELVLDKARVARATEPTKLVYGWNGDDDPVAWLGYDFRTSWAFKGGGTYQTDWTAASAPMISLFAPYERRVVHVSGDGPALKARGVRTVVVQLEYPFFGQARRQRVVLRPGAGSLDDSVEITLPQGQYDCDAGITWSFTDGRTVSTRMRDSSGWIFVDDPTAAPPPPAPPLTPNPPEVP
jgi:hypothetical protein